jgi:fructosamine-3-kinase
MSPELRAALEQRLGTQVIGAKELGGGDINDAFEVSLGNGASIFVKTHPNPPDGMFEAEARGLRWLEEAGAIRIPQVVAASDRRPAYLALELLAPAKRLADFDCMRLGRRRSGSTTTISSGASRNPTSRRTTGRRSTGRLGWNRSCVSPLIAA